MNNYRCSVCDKFLPIDKSQIKTGDKVSISVGTATKNGTRIRYTSKRACVVDITGDTVTVTSGRKEMVVSLDVVSPVGAPNALTVSFIGECNCRRQANDPNSAD
ncbi:TPA: hypothetical protein P9I69_000211 [Klebsiella pneumoniae]|uniref:hypothetical protein n=1 Tax=Klebsiella pneumoniae TaxID=573 RepID=UPI0010840661|nr:hypothetical protein [Klebsiella pneumoniae]HBW3560778.1 hypothetical protein [Klebsiella pneumoniae]HBW8255855.1 hypothetical protein [Klebsiella pneumoniae]HCU0483053.1 hypothetical protein [Klebsiella pneumoniae]HDQ4809247.1 hypothetical protein [Klebsiella pneumoniae]HDQ4841635.1 hypothetical protein [Klebsiella pneumoniae]